MTAIANLIDLASAGVVVLAVLSAGAALAATRRRGVALAVLLDLLTAAGLLHLAADPSYMRAASAGVVLVIRRLITWSLANGKAGMGTSMGPRMRFRTGFRIGPRTKP
jgi:hypothetical protein